MSRMLTLRDLRERAGLTQAEAGANIGLTADHIVEMETTDLDELSDDDVDMYFDAVGYDADDPDECFELDDEDEDEDALSLEDE